MIHLATLFVLFVLFVFAQYNSVCLFNSVLLCKVMSIQSAIINKGLITTKFPAHQTW
jgi:hypothetical protein